MPPVDVGGGLLSTSICLIPKLELLFLQPSLIVPSYKFPQACCLYHSMKLVVFITQLHTFVTLFRPLFFGICSVSPEGSFSY